MSTSATTVERPAARGLWLALAGLSWMIGLVWSARATITSRDDAATEVTLTAYALPGATSAALVAGAAVALAGLALLGRRGRKLGATARFAAATGIGLLVGLPAALTFVTINTEGWVYAVVGGTVAAAATLGGALAGVRAPRVVAATCWAALAVLAIGFLVNTVQDPLLGVFGAGDTSASQAGAAGRFSLAQSIVGGLAAGIIAFVALRRRPAAAGAGAGAAGAGAGAAAGAGPVRWPLYALAGAGPGLLLLVAEALSRTAGARVLDLAGRVSPLEQVVQQVLSEARFRNALIVLFIGALTAILAVGRTLGPPVPPRADSSRADSVAVDPPGAG